MEAVEIRSILPFLTPGGRTTIPEGMMWPVTKNEADALIKQGNAVMESDFQKSRELKERLFEGKKTTIPSIVIAEGHPLKVGTYFLCPSDVFFKWVADQLIERASEDAIFDAELKGEEVEKVQEKKTGKKSGK